MQFDDGEIELQAKMRRLTASIPSSYTIHKVGSTYYAESCVSGGTDYEDPDFETVFQAAIDATTQGAIHLKELDETVDTEIQLKKRVSIDGLGFGLGGLPLQVQPTVLRLPAGATHRILDYDEGSAQTLGISIRNITFDHPAGDAAPELVHIKNGNQVLLENLEFRNGSTNDNLPPLHIESAENTWLRNIYMHGSRTTSLVLNSTTRTILDNVIISNSVTVPTSATAGIRLAGADKVTIHNCQIELCDHGVRAWQAEDLKILDSLLWNCGRITDDTYSYVKLDSTCKRVLIQGNTFHESGTQANKAKYAIDIATACEDVKITDDNDFIGTFRTRILNDAGVNTRLPHVIVPFVDGTACEDSGWDIDAGGEYARAFTYLPHKVHEVQRIKIYARSIVLEADAMRLEININAGASNEAYNTEAIAVANKPSATTNFAADDIIYWVLTSTDDADIADLAGGDSFEVKVLHEAAGGDDCQTDARFRTVEIEYV